MKTYIITGSSDGLGQALTKLLVADGHTVVGISKTDSLACSTSYVVDFSIPEEVDTIVAEIMKNYQKVDGIIHCVGKMYFDDKGAIEYSKMQEAVQSNVIGITVFTSGCMPIILKNESDLIFVSSTVGLKSYKNQGIYTATKRAERGIAKYFQTELADTGSRVISFCPGGMQTRFHEKCTGSTIDHSEYMPVEGVATCLKQILYLPKYMEVSEIIINRKVKNIKTT